MAFAGAERDTGRLACHVALFGPDWAAMIAEIHYWTAPWARGRGYAAEAARAAARWALTERGFARITLRTVTGNTASQKVARTAGFRFEGIMRNAAWSRGPRRHGRLQPDTARPRRRRGRFRRTVRFTF